MLMTRKDWETRRDLFPETCPDAVELIQATADTLLATFYMPGDNSDYVLRLDSTRVAAAGLEKESINWGDLQCVHVEALPGSDVYRVEVEEADSPALARWLERQLLRCGWHCVVVTSW